MDIYIKGKDYFIWDLKADTKMATSQVTPDTSCDGNVEMWRVKKLIKRLEAARG